MRVDGARAHARYVKCVVWDLDDTLWRGVLLEGDDVVLDETAIEVARTLDERGILNSVASRNDGDAAIAKLRDLGVEELFLYPQIGWGAKSEAVARIADALNVGLDTIAFVDDQRFELEEVAFSLPQVRCIDRAELAHALDRPELNPPATADARVRRIRYRQELARRRDEDSFTGPKHEFLDSLGMVMRIWPARDGDVVRAEELTLRTTQLNTTGRTYTAAELERLRESPDHALLMASLEDRHGEYGTIGLALVEQTPDRWTIKLLLASCRVMSTGAGMGLLAYVLHEARAAGVELLAEFVATERNRPMYMSYRLAGFKDGVGGAPALRHELAALPPIPEYLNLEVEPSVGREGAPARA